MSSLFSPRRFLLLVLLLTNAAITVCEDDPALSEDPVADPALSEDPVATDAHPDVEAAWIFPDCPDGKVPIGGSTDLVAALANAGSKVFNVSHIEGKLMTASGKTVRELKRYEYGQNLGAREQRSFRYPLPIDAETPLGELTFVAKVFYNTKDKTPYVSVVFNDTIELVPALPDKDAQLRAIQIGAGGGLVVLLVLSAARFMIGTSSSTGNGNKKAAPKEGGSTAEANEWIKNLPAVRAVASDDKPRKPKRG